MDTWQVPGGLEDEAGLADAWRSLEAPDSPPAGVVGLLSEDPQGFSATLIRGPWEAGGIEPRLTAPLLPRAEPQQRGAPRHAPPRRHVRAQPPLELLRVPDDSPSGPPRDEPLDGIGQTRLDLLPLDVGPHHEGVGRASPQQVEGTTLGWALELASPLRLTGRGSLELKDARSVPQVLRRSRRRPVQQCVDPSVSFVPGVEGLQLFGTKPSLEALGPQEVLHQLGEIVPRKVLERRRHPSPPKGGLLALSGSSTLRDHSPRAYRNCRGANDALQASVRCGCSMAYSSGHDLSDHNTGPESPPSWL